MSNRERFFKSLIIPSLRCECLMPKNHGTVANRVSRKVDIVARVI